MECPTCKTEMRDIEELADTSHADVNGFPRFEWCPNCGTTVGGSGKNALVHKPKEVK